MWNLKSCPRCGGDLFPDWAQHVWYDTCLQCGYDRIRQEIVDVDEKAHKNSLKRAEKKALVSATI
ncbi:MAG: hypothetical protein KKF26_04185 [Chloroflexi bacterium]|nr:hypothetical protein [Chloroflexota bacterium]